MFRVLLAPITRSTTAAYSHRLCMVWCVMALEQVLVWDTLTLKHGQLNLQLVTTSPSVYNILTVFDVQKPNKGRQKPGQCNWTQKLTITVIRTESESTFAQVCQSLSYPHHKQIVRVLRVKLCQLTKHSS
jgi:hypothetical protein